MKRNRVLLVSIASLLLCAFMGLFLDAELVSVATANEADAAARTDLPVDILAWLSLMPELSNAPAPTWLKVGARITYHVMSAAREGETTPAGETIVQYDVVSKDADTVLTTAGVHVIGSGGSLGAPKDTGFVVGVPGVGDVWISPAALPKAEKHAQKNLTITHISMDVNGAATKAVRFEYTEGTARSVSVFDEAKGVLLYRIQASGNIDTTRQSSVVSQFVSVRQLPAAWTGGITPAWASAGTSLRYDGTMSVNVGYGSPGPLMGLSMVGRITNASPAGVCVKWETYLSGSKTEERLSLSSSALPAGGIFLPQAALATLKNGKALDTDSTTGVTISTAPSYLSVDGKQLLCLIHEGRSYKRVYGYDRQNGMLTYYNEKSQDGIASVQVELKLTGVSK